MATKKIVDIPEKHREICREFAQLAVKHGLTSLEVKYKPAQNDDVWNDAISMAWQAGWHGDNDLSIVSSLYVYDHINSTKETSDGKQD